GSGVGDGRWLVGPGDDFLARASRERPGQGGTENRQSSEGRTAIGEEVPAQKVIGMHCLAPSIQARSILLLQVLAQRLSHPELVVRAVPAPEADEATPGVEAGHS